MWKLVVERDFYLFFKLGLNIWGKNPNFDAPPHSRAEHIIQLVPTRTKS